MTFARDDKTMIEKHVKDALRAYLKEIGAYYFMPVQTGYGARTLDFLICHKGVFYGVETKRPGVKQPSSAQAVCMAAIVRAGGAVCLENSIGLETVREMIR